MVQYRPDGGLTFKESMARAHRFETRASLAEHVKPWRIVEIKPYGITEHGERDHRNGWLTHVVIGELDQADGRYVIGFTDGPLP